MSVTLNGIHDTGNYNVANSGIEKQSGFTTQEAGYPKTRNQKNVEQSASNRENVEKENVTAEDLAKKSKELSDVVQSMGARLNFNVHEKTGRLMVKMVDLDGNVLKEFPPKDFLDMVSRIRDYIGSLIDEKV